MAEELVSREVILVIFTFLGTSLGRSSANDVVKPTVQTFSIFSYVLLPQLQGHQ